MTTAERNRANSQHSTGPVTEEGKHRSSMNALRHGLTSQQLVILPDENKDDYDRILEAFRAEYDPQGATELHLTQSLIDLAWRLRRVVTLETNLLIEALPTELQIKSLATLSMHSQRLSRQFEKTRAELQALQQSRRDAEQEQLTQLLDIMEMKESEGEPYDPTEAGFVFSNEQLDPAKVLRLRTRQAQKARHFCSTHFE